MTSPSQAGSLNSECDAAREEWANQYAAAGWVRADPKATGLTSPPGWAATGDPFAAARLGTRRRMTRLSQIVLANQCSSPRRSVWAAAFVGWPALVADFLAAAALVRTLAGGTLAALLITLSLIHI